MTFWENVKQIFHNMPLILSESKDPTDISLNRVITFGIALTLLISPIIVFLFFKEYRQELLDIWTKGLAFLGAQTTGNLFIKNSKINVEAKKITPPAITPKVGKARFDDGLDE